MEKQFFQRNFNFFENSEEARKSQWPLFCSHEKNLKAKLLYNLIFGFCPLKVSFLLTASIGGSVHWAFGRQTRTRGASPRNVMTIMNVAWRDLRDACEACDVTVSRHRSFRQVRLPWNTFSFFFFFFIFNQTTENIKCFKNAKKRQTIDIFLLLKKTFFFDMLQSQLLSDTQFYAVVDKLSSTQLSKCKMPYSNFFRETAQSSSWAWLRICSSSFCSHRK